MKNVLIFLAAILFLGACSIQSRKYRSGYHIESLTKSNDRSASSKKAVVVAQPSEKKKIETIALTESVVDEESEVATSSFEDFADKKMARNEPLMAKKVVKLARKENIIIKTFKQFKAIPDAQKARLIEQIKLAKASNSNYPYELLNGNSGGFLLAIIGAVLTILIMYLLIFFIMIILFA